METPPDNVIDLDNYKYLKAFVQRHNCPFNREIIQKLAKKEFLNLIAPVLKQLGRSTKLIDSLAEVYADTILGEKFDSVDHALKIILTLNK